MGIVVFRLGHRIPRDERISTHVALVTRAFGGDEIIYSGKKDDGLELSIAKIVEDWGGNFSIHYEKNFIKEIKNYKNRKFVIVHLTMYGVPLKEKINQIKDAAVENMLVIVGSERVPSEVYEIADYNIAITSQPHSEVAALSVFLDHFMDGRELERSFDSRFGGKKIIPQERGKNILKL